MPIFRKTWQAESFFLKEKTVPNPKAVRFEKTTGV
jgi:hypothetical protein